VTIFSQGKDQSEITASWWTEKAENS